MSPSIIIMFLVAAAISVFIAFILSNLARHQGLARLKLEEDERRRQEEETTALLQSNKSLSENVEDVLNQLTESDKLSRQASEHLLEIFSREVKKHVEVNTKEVAKHYESIIEEKTKDQEVVWKKYNSALVEKKQTDAVIRSVAEGLVVVGPDGKVLMMNPAAEKLLGVNKKEKLGKPINEDLREEQLITLTKQNKDTGGKEIELASESDETKKILRASSAVIENENGETVGMVSVLSDITRQKELERMKTGFVASVSHELRTPLIAIDKSLQLILSKTTGSLTETQEQFLTIAERNLKRLSRLIDDLLDMSKLEAGKMTLKRQPASLEKIIADSVFALDNWAKTKFITIEKNVAAALPEVNVDADRLTQILNNLMGNAIKFTPAHGTITVTAAVKKPGEVEISVRDTGIGISPENLGKVFDKFYQVGERVSTDISGTGLGLSIVKELVELHGGKIWVDSDKGQGTTFTFTLPV